MTLKELRQKFVEITGRYDLVEDDVDFVDNGADFYITQANKELYKDQDILPNEMEVSFSLPSGTSILPIPNLITLKENGLYYIDTAGNKHFISTMTKAEFDKYFSSNRKGALIRSQPLVFTSNTYGELTTTDNVVDWVAYGFIIGMKIRISGSVSNDGDYVVKSVTSTKLTMTTDFVTETEVTASAAGYFGTPGSPEYARYIGLNINGQAIVNEGNIGIYFSKPFDAAVTLFVEGLYLDDLVEDTDESYWSIKTPMLVLAQAGWFLEMTYRNSAGMADWEKSIARLKADLEAQYTELTTRDIEQMREAY